MVVSQEKLATMFITNTIRHSMSIEKVWFALVADVNGKNVKVSHDNVDGAFAQALKVIIDYLNSLNDKNK